MNPSYRMLQCYIQYCMLTGNQQSCTRQEFHLLSLYFINWQPCTTRETKKISQGHNFQPNPMHSRHLLPVLLVCEFLCFQTIEMIICQHFSSNDLSIIEGDNYLFPSLSANFGPWHKESLTKVNLCMSRVSSTGITTGSPTCAVMVWSSNTRTEVIWNVIVQHFLSCKST